MKRRLGWSLVLVVAVAVAACLLHDCTNDPWPSGLSDSSTFFTNYSTEFKTFDPAVSYYVHEGEVLDNIVEMPVCYDYLKRPYEVVPMLAEKLPEPVYYDRRGQRLEGDPAAADVARVEYLVMLKKGVQYQPHPCFAKSPETHPEKYQSLARFPVLGTREMKAVDFKVALTRLCDTRLASPIYSTFQSFIAGMDECSDSIKAEVKSLEEEQEKRGMNPERYPVLPDYRRIPLAGVEIIDDYQFKLVLSRKYPQALYWMCLHFFSPVPFEALEFFARKEVVDAGFAFKNWPVGTGAYMMVDCNLRDYLTLEKNPNYHGDVYPSSGMPDDVAMGLLADAGKPLPFIKRIRFQFERESIPIWIKFLQGYYDTSGVPTDMYDTAVNMETNGDMSLSDEMSERGMQMISSVSATSFYVGFNMMDPVIGGMTPQRKKLRQAISIALDFQEYIDVFLNGRGIAGQSIIPPGIYGAPEGEGGVNPFISEWDAAKGRPVRKSLEAARQLMTEAGYPGGIGTDGKPLVLHYDASGAGSFAKTTFLWLRQRLSPLGITLEERLTDLNRFREKVNTGDWQMLITGWVADYPDPENFLFLFKGANGLVVSKGRGSNKTNYSSPEFDAVFDKLETMDNGPERLKLINEATRIIQEDAPCCWGYHPMNLVLTHGWLKNYKPHHMGKTFMKCRRIDTEKRMEFQKKFNQPVRWPGYAALTLLAVAGLAMIWRREKSR